MPSRVQVAIRTRPTSHFARDELKIDTKAKTIKVHVTKDTSQYVNNQQEDWGFKFNTILHNVNQETTYDLCAEDIVNSVLEGYNGTIMAYGQTGAGKTFTMMGGTQSYKYRGIAPRAVSHIFRYVETHPQVAISVRVSYLEVYNEQFYDLLQDNTRLQDLAVMDDSNGNVLVKGLSLKTATSEEEALNLLFEGETNRAIAEHQMNKNSTRSHCIFTMHLDIRSRIDSSEKLVKSKLNLIDLAGSERVKNTGSSGRTLQEANFINKSLTFLEQVVIALSSKTREHIPFRQSKLTNVLRDSLGGNCKTRLIANVWCETRHINETVSTLKFATRMMRVSNTPVVNAREDPAMLLKKYKRQVRELKQELAMHDSLANRTSIQYEAYTPEQRQAAYDQVEAYVEGKIPEMKVVNVRQIHETFRQFKEYVLKLKENQPVRAVAPEPEENEGKGMAKLGVEGRDFKSEKAGGGEYVGDLDHGVGGFHLGEADDNAAPVQPEVLQVGTKTSSPVARHTSNQSSRPTSVHSPATQKSAPTAPIPGLSEEEAFEEYKKTEGLADSKLFEENKGEYQSKKSELKSLSQAVNEIKLQIDEMSVRLEDIRANDRGSIATSADGIPVISEEEFLLLKSLKVKKKEYQSAFHKRKMVKDEVSYMKSLVKQAKLKLCSKFLEWYKKNYSQYISLPEQQVTVQIDENAHDVLDDGEHFEKLERQRVIEKNPDSLAFFNAKKHMMANLKRKKKGFRGSRR